MSDSIKKIAGDSFYLYLTQGLNYILPFLILPYLIKTLSTDSFGIFIYSQAVMQIMLLCVDFGFNISATKAVSMHSNNIKKIVEIFWSITIIKFIFSLFVLAVAILFFLNVSSLLPYKNGVLIAGLSVLGSVGFPVWLFQGLGKVRLMAILSSVSTRIFLPLIFVFVRKPDDFIIAILLHTLVQIGMGCIGMGYVLAQDEFRIFSKKYFLIRNLKLYVKDSFPIFLSNSAISLYTSGITFMLGFFVDTKIVGVYGAIDRIVRVICFGVYGPISQATFPIIVKTKLVSLNKAKDLLRKIFFGMLVLMCFISLAYFVVDDYVLEKYFSELKDYKLLLSLSVLSIIPISLGGVCGQLGLIAIGESSEKKIFSKIYIYVGTCSLVISYLAISIWQLNGAVFSVIASEVFVFLLMFYFSIKKKILW